MNDPSKPQPAPQSSNHPNVVDLVIADLQERWGGTGLQTDLDLVIRDLEEMARDGEKKYGVRLRPHNGRCALTDAYQESCDLSKYLRQTVYEEPSSVTRLLYFKSCEMMLSLRQLIRERG